MKSSPGRVFERSDPVKHAAYLPFLLFSIANGLSRTASQFYGQRFGVGVTEWRLLSALAEYPRASANELCKFADMDKAAASRSIAVLKKFDYVRDEADSQDARRRILAITPKGVRLHDAMRAEALKRETAMTEGLSEGDVKTLIAMLQRIRNNVSAMGVSR